MPTAYVHLREDPHYRRVAFINAFARLGYIVVQGQPQKEMHPSDVAVIWNKTPRSRLTFEAARRAGAACIVAENGYVGFDDQGRRPYALALDGHCGSGRWFVGDDSRLNALDIDFKPMRALGSRALIAGQRGIGSPLMRSPHDFIANTARSLDILGWDVLVRPHPGPNPPQRLLADDFAEVDQVVVWTSNVATQALIQGLPTFYAAPTIITKGAARSTSGPVIACNEEERHDAFQRLSWAQWFIDEIESGDAIPRLLDVHAGVLPPYHPGFGL